MTPALTVAAIISVSLMNSANSALAAVSGALSIVLPFLFTALGLWPSPYQSVSNGLLIKSVLLDLSHPLAVLFLTLGPIVTVMTAAFALQRWTLEQLRPR